MLVDKKIVNIKIRKVTSAYAFAGENQKRIAEVQINRTIGSSVTSVNKMLTNADEQKAIMGSIISISPNSSNWETKLKNYWDSFTEDIPENGKKLEVGFVYDIDSISKKVYIDNINKGISKESDKLKTDTDLKEYIDSRLDAVYNNFKKTIKHAHTITDAAMQDKLVKEAYRIKNDSIWTIESERYKVGTPIRPFDYMLYKYCLVYGDVANEKATVNNSAKIRFYLQSETDLAREKKSKLNIERKRSALLGKVIDSAEDMENLLYSMGVTNIPTDDSELYEAVSKISKERESEFIAAASDKDLAIRGEIEKYIANGILRRIEGSAKIYNPNELDKPIANNLDEAIMYFKDKANQASVNEYRVKFKNLVK